MSPALREDIEWDIPLRDHDHVFLKGHRIMVQIQSTWFPIIDRIPQNSYPASTKRQLPIMYQRITLGSDSHDEIEAQSLFDVLRQMRNRYPVGLSPAVLWGTFRLAANAKILVLCTHSGAECGSKKNSKFGLHYRKQRAVIFLAFNIERTGRTRLES
jgi:hypothetical protein